MGFYCWLSVTVTLPLNFTVLSIVFFAVDLQTAQQQVGTNFLMIKLLSVNQMMMRQFIDFHDVYMAINVCIDQELKAQCFGGEYREEELVDHEIQRFAGMHISIITITIGITKRRDGGVPISCSMNVSAMMQQKLQVCANIMHKIPHTHMFRHTCIHAHCTHILTHILHRHAPLFFKLLLYVYHLVL